MSSPAPDHVTLPILNTVLAHLAPHFLGATDNDIPAARQAAGAMLADYKAETTQELHLAAAIIGFGFQALEALTEAAAAELSLNRTIRLRGSAVSLSREAHKARRKLDQLQRARRTVSDTPERNAPAQQPEIGSQLSSQTSPPKTTPTAHLTPALPLSRQQRRAAERAAAKDLARLAEQARRQALKSARTPITTPPTGPRQQAA